MKAIHKIIDPEKVVCKDCSGTGFVNDTPCLECCGSGEVKPKTK